MLPVPFARVSGRNESTLPTAITAAPNRSGRSVIVRPTKTPPALPPSTASRFLDGAVGSVGVQQERVAAIELRALGEHDRYRHLDAVVALHAQLARLDGDRRVEASRGCQRERSHLVAADAAD
jgi:hypothetical protein